MSEFIKICGVTTQDAIGAAVAGGATHIGFNFAAHSPRLVTLETAAALSRHTPDRIVRVAVTVDADDAFLADILRAVRPNALQLHGGEEPQRAAHVAARFGLPVIKAIALSSEAELRIARSYQTAADILLFDAKPPKDGVAQAAGGHGHVFDWQILKGQHFAKPWFLSGGLTPGNVAQAIRQLRPGGVDVASGVESSRGVKDALLIQQFCGHARDAFAAEAVA